MLENTIDITFEEVSKLMDELCEAEISNISTGKDSELFLISSQIIKHIIKNNYFMEAMLNLGEKLNSQYPTPIAMMKLHVSSGHIYLSLGMRLAEYLAAKQTLSKIE